MRLIGRVAACVAVLFGLAGGPSAVAQTWPTKAVSIVIPFPPGPGLDFVARMVAQSLGSPFSLESVNGRSLNLLPEAKQGFRHFKQPSRRTKADCRDCMPCGAWDNWPASSLPPVRMLPRCVSGPYSR
mgnify:CR=1 FL=1